jgi:hypothetical protein
VKGDASVCQRSLSSKAAAAMMPYRGVAAKPSSMTSSASKSTNRVVAVGAASVSGMPLTSYLRTGCEEFRMLGLQGPSQSAQITSDGRIFDESRSDHKNGRNRRACCRPGARPHPPTPHDRAAPLAAASKLTCE